jgi:uncharacterized lipoprotein YddW (UPF0748 family)
MRAATVIVIVVLAAIAAELVPAQDAATLQVTGRGIEGRAAYRGGGVVRFQDVSLGAQVVHYRPGEPLPLPMEIEYQVVEPAPILLTSRLGTEHWRLYDISRETTTALYTDEQIDLSEPGQKTAQVTTGRIGSSYGPPPTGGLAQIRGHYYFLIDQPDGAWLDVTDPPAFFDHPELARELVFTLADTSRYELSIGNMQSTWEPGGPFRLQLVVVDATEHVHPVIGAPLVATAGDWQTTLSAGWTPLNEPTGWLHGRLPQAVPDELRISAEVSVSTPQGLRTHEVTSTSRRGEGQVGAEAFQIADQGYRLPRTADGRVRETRAIWASTSDIATADGIDTLVTRCRQAGLNTIIPDILVRNTFLARSDLMPMAASIPDEFDPLAYLIERAHAAGLEVHPWFCVTYRDRAFRKWFADRYEVNVDMIDPEGNVVDLGADVHRPAYRQFIVDLMAGVARDYDVDGIHLDYIRSMGRCYCHDCREEFAALYGKPLAEADEDAWVLWQRRAIGDIVARTSAGVRGVRPEAKLSAAVFANMSGGAGQGQDPAAWAEAGWMDLIIPMDYQMQTVQVRAHEREFLSALTDDDKLVTGLSLYVRHGSQVASRDPDLVVQQIELVRRLGIHGYCLFAYSHLSDAQLEALRDQVNAQPAVPYFR